MAATTAVMPGNPPDTGLNDMELINIFLKQKFVSNKDLRVCRSVSRNWEACVRANPKFQAGLNGKIVDKWYKDAGDQENFENALPWNSCTLFHFKYRGKQVSFKNYWHFAGSLLKKLTISNCSLECDGFELLLGQCPVLETLVLSRSQFRDLDDFHNNPNFHQGFPAAPAAPAVTRCLRHLTIEHVNKIEQCFMDYLNRRTGNLESLTLQHCFFDPIFKKGEQLPPIRHDNKFQKALPPRPSLEQRFLEFQNNLCSLLVANANTLRKVGFHSNKYQNLLFQTLVDKIGPFGLLDLELTFLMDEPDYGPAILLLNTLTLLEKLSLNFEGPVTSTVIGDLTRCHRVRLQKLDLSIVGNRVGVDPIELRELNEFQNLQCLRIRDTKQLNPFDLRQVYGGRRLPQMRRRYYARANGNSINDLLTGLDSKFNPNLFSNLPPTITQLSINRYMTPTNFMTGLAGNDRALESFRRLTKLEIQGPCVHSFNGVLPIIAQEMTQLNTLILTDLGINDEHITGLPASTIRRLRQCITLGMLMDDGNNDAPAAPQPEQQNVRNFENLRHLDLSKNKLLSDVSFTEGLRIPGLETLHLNNCNRMTDNSLVVISQKFPNLLELGLLNCKRFSRLGLQTVVEKCRKIHSIYCNRRVLNHIAGQAFAPVNPNYDHIVKIVKSTNS